MNIQTDIEYLEAGIPELENYLLSDELYYPLGRSLPQLTLGGLLLALARSGLRAESFRARLETLRAQWLSAWEKKSAREVTARSRSWSDYLEEYRDDPKAGARLYPQNVRYRAMLTLLGQAEHETDAFVKSVFKAGNFVWEANCAPNFERDTFWYLYGTLKEQP